MSNSSLRVSRQLTHTKIPKHSPKAEENMQTVAQESHIKHTQVGLGEKPQIPPPKKSVDLKVVQRLLEVIDKPTKNFATTEDAFDALLQHAGITHASAQNASQQIPAATNDENHPLLMPAYPYIQKDTWYALIVLAYFNSKTYRQQNKTQADELGRLSTIIDFIGAKLEYDISKNSVDIKRTQAIFEYLFDANNTALQYKQDTAIKENKQKAKSQANWGRVWSAMARHIDNVRQRNHGAMQQALGESNNSNAQIKQDIMNRFLQALQNAGVFENKLLRSVISP